MQKQIELMMKCIRCEVFNVDVDMSYFNNFTADEWSNVLELSASHDLAHIIADFIIRYRVVSDEDIISDAGLSVRTAIQRYSKQTYELNRIKALFEKNKIPFVVLKGPVIRKWYPQEWFRTSCDIDILVEENSLEKAKKALEEELQYNFRSKNYHDCSFYSPSNIHLELHFSLLEGNKNIDSLLKDAWEYSCPIDENKIERCFTHEYFAFHIIAHLYHHFLSGGCGIKSFIDLKIMFEKCQLDTDILSNIFEKTEIKAFVEKANLLSDIWFGEEPHNEITKIMERYILNGGTYGTVGNKALTEQIKMGKSKSFFNRIFMPYPSLCLRFKKEKIDKWKIPYYQVARWLLIVKKGNFKKGVRELSIRATTEHDDVALTTIMMNALGIK